MTPHDAAAGEGPLHGVLRFVDERLRLIFPPPRFHHEMLPGPLAEATLGRLAEIRPPFVGLAPLGVTPLPNVGRSLRLTVRLGVYLVASNPKTAGRVLGDKLGPGLAQMAHAALVGLHGFTVGGAGDGGAGTLAATGGDVLDGLLWAQHHAALWAQTLEVPATFLLPPEDALKTLAAQWTFDGETRAAADTITLEGA